jgi:hypothetical protein
VSHLERLLQSYGRATGVAPNRVRRWLTMMVMIGALDRMQADPDQPLFLVKGGVAMELRLRQGARATRDLDMVFLGDPDQLMAALDTALAERYSLFSFERGPAEPIGHPQALAARRRPAPTKRASSPSLRAGDGRRAGGRRRRRTPIPTKPLTTVATV